jgi:hypothetical protein
MACVCGNDRIMEVSGKTSDMCFVEYDGYETEGYVPRDLNIGGGDYLQFKMCLECGRVQGTFPIPETTVLKVVNKEGDSEDE